MIRVQQQQLIQRLGQDRVDLVGLSRHAERHAHEVVDVTQRVVRVKIGLAGRLLVSVGRDCRDLGQQADRRDLHLTGIERIQRVLIERREGGNRRREHRHRMRIAREAVEEAAQVLVQHRVHANLRLEVRELIS